jgi:hypothetical protein
MLILGKQFSYLVIMSMSLMYFPNDRFSILRDFAECRTFTNFASLYMFMFLGVSSNFSFIDLLFMSLSLVMKIRLIE